MCNTNYSHSIYALGDSYNYKLLVNLKVDTENELTEQCIDKATLIYYKGLANVETNEISLKTEHDTTLGIIRLYALKDNFKINLMSISKINDNTILISDIALGICQFVLEIMPFIGNLTFNFNEHIKSKEKSYDVSKVKTGNTLRVLINTSKPGYYGIVSDSYHSLI